MVNITAQFNSIRYSKCTILYRYILVLFQPFIKKKKYLSPVNISKVELRHIYTDQL